MVGGAVFWWCKSHFLNEFMKLEYDLQRYFIRYNKLVRLYTIRYSVWYVALSRENQSYCQLPVECTVNATSSTYWILFQTNLCLATFDPHTRNSLLVYSSVYFFNFNQQCRTLSTHPSMSFPLSIQIVFSINAMHESNAALV